MDLRQSLSLLLPLLFVSWILRVLYRAYATPLRDIPGPWLAKFTRFWHAKAIGSRDFQKTNLDLHRQYGPIVRVSPNEFSIDDPEAAKIIYRTRDQLPKEARYSGWGLPTGEPNLFTYLDIQKHAERRRQISPLYQLSALLNLEHQIDITSHIFMDRMTGFASNGESIDMSQWLQLYAFDCIGYLTFGKPFGFLEKGADLADIMATIHTYSRYGGVIGIFSEWHPRVFQLLQMTAPGGNVGIAYIHDFAAKTIAKLGSDPAALKALKNESLGEESLKGDYLTSLYARHQKNPDSFLEEDIFYHTLPNVIAGAETTGATLIGMLYYLCRNKPVLSKLRKELDEFNTTKKSQEGLSMKEAQDLPYLQAVVKETIRIFPATGLLMPRVVPKGGLTLANRFFPEGAVVGCNPWVAHFNRDVFGQDAHEFRPERWLEDAEKSNNMDQYILTFSKGPRSCLGKNISLMEMSKLIPELVQHFDIELVHPEREWTVYNDWFMKPEDFPVKLSKRAV